MKKRANGILNSIRNNMILIVLLIAAQLAVAHDGHHTSQAWQACEAKSVDDSCSYVMQTNKLYKGSCRAMTQALMCVRNEPITLLSKEELDKIVKDLPKTPENTK